MNDHSFYRGSRVLSPANHIVIVIMENGSEYLRRVSMNADQMAQLERQLMLAQHQGDIAAYVITSAADCSFPELTDWVDSLGNRSEQGQLLSLEQNTLFAS